MSFIWESIAESSRGEYASDELEATAYRLVVEQVLYYSDRNSRNAYWMVSTHEREFRQALAPLGIDVHVNKKLQYAYAEPRHSKAGSATIGQTIFALVLRMIYDTAARSGQMNGNGEVVCDLEDLYVKYQELSGREMPMKGKLDALLETMKRWGIARKSEDYNLADGGDHSLSQPYAVIIRPAIADLLGESTLAHLARFKTDAPSAGDESVEETAAEQAENETEAR